MNTPPIAPNRNTDLAPNRNTALVPSIDRSTRFPSSFRADNAHAHRGPSHHYRGYGRDLGHDRFGHTRGFGLGFSYNVYSDCYHFRRYPSVYYPAYAYPYSYYPYVSYPYSSPTYISTYYDVDRYDREPYPSTVYEAPRTTAPEYDSREQAASSAAEPYIEKGEAAFAEGKYDEARSLMRRATLADPRNGYAAVIYGLTEYALGDYRAAAEAVRRGLAADPQMVDGPPDFEAIYKGAPDVQRHLSNLERYASDRPDDADAHLLLGFVHYAVGHPQPAAEQFDRAAQLDRSDSLASMLRDAARAAAGGHGATPSPESQPPETPEP